MIAKGTDCSDYFPAVVKNVVAKNSEVNKRFFVILICGLSTGEKTGICLFGTIC